MCQIRGELIIFGGSDETPVATNTHPASIEVEAFVYHVRPRMSAACSVRGEGTGSPESLSMPNTRRSALSLSSSSSASGSASESMSKSNSVALRQWHERAMAREVSSCVGLVQAAEDRRAETRFALAASMRRRLLDNVGLVNGNAGAYDDADPMVVMARVNRAAALGRTVAWGEGASASAGFAGTMARSGASAARLLLGGGPAAENPRLKGAADWACSEAEDAKVGPLHVQVVSVIEDGGVCGSVGVNTDAVGSIIFALHLGSLLIAEK